MAERRKFERNEAKCTVNIELQKNKHLYQNIQVLNIGGGGISFILNEEIAKGEIINIYFPTITVRSYIIWQQENRYGAMFANPLGDEIELICQHCFR